MSHPDDPPHGPADGDTWPGSADALHRGGSGAAAAHVDSDTLALVALDEPAGAGVDAHIAGCPVCRAELESFAHVVTMGRALDTADELLSPPRGVWERIAADLGIDPGLLPADATVTTIGAGSTSVARHAADPDTAPTPSESDDSEPGDSRVVSLEDRRSETRAASQPGTTRRRIGRGFLVAAAVGGILAGVGITLGWEALDGPAVVASAPLEPVDGNVGDGEAELVGSGVGRELKVQLDVDPPPGTYFQVWLMSPDATRMVPVGVLENHDGFWRVPAGLDLSAFPLVDVSVEQFDGNSAHSGDSVVRGSLSSA